MSDIPILRMPPEPSSSLHLGHLKAMIFDFDMHKDCICILRMDDTNPESEKQEYVDAIIEDVNWLGFKPYKITYTSDYFDILINYAFDLIKANLAYVDFSTGDEIKSMRHTGTESKYRNNTPDYNLDEFKKMLEGEYDENTVVLRLKIDMSHVNHTLRDPIAYRVKFAPHYKTGSKYKCYPSYDFSHGIVDALENITHSYCTMEFYVRRELYYWSILKLNELGHSLKPAEVTEFGRLNVENNYLSKRKILKLLSDKKIDSLDDPRLMTIRGLKRRGFTAETLKKIIKENTSMDRNESCLSEDLINHYVRHIYDEKAFTVFGIINPIEVIIDDPTFENKNCEHPNHPTNKEMGSHITKLTKKIYIDSDDFREVDDPTYYRLAPSKTIRLRYNDFFKYSHHEIRKDNLSVHIVPVQSVLIHLMYI